MPWGIIAGLFGIFAFWVTAAVVILQIVFTFERGQTGNTASLFGTGVQTALFVIDLILLLLFIASLAIFITVKVRGGKHENIENNTQ